MTFYMLACAIFVHEEFKHWVSNIISAALICILHHLSDRLIRIHPNFVLLLFDPFSFPSRRNPIQNLTKSNRIPFVLTPES